MATNPKDEAALKKVPLWTLPAIGAVHGAQATADGVRKGYGPFNWRETPISLREHLAAIERHVACLKDGEWHVQDSEIPITHLGCINAGTCIILDAHQCKTLLMDLPSVPGHVGDEFERYKRSMK